ncbi:GTPase [Mesonia sp. MT50]|uniref:GTPase n=1 Tax=Mesonia profundi TaxID=3070998 RepID=A0ABU1A3G8_9FLAO|nr:GTPase [Mesonia profundi]MDQ7918242.1 GTPase [Mesonia profundi]
MSFKKEPITQLIFVYKANSGKGNAYLDAAQKILKPKASSCNLCAITHGVFTENKTWKAFRKEMRIPTEFLHQDEFRKEYASKFSTKFEFPIVLGVTALGWEVVVDASRLNGINSAEALIKIIKEEVEL